ncbi:integral membrane protein [Lactiplantibacillus plantarum]|nr:integral membrane protein [Lactiplantibacillus plantarum]MCG0808067.1 integral membrane protein [Lactiplantibacillus plantarum]
MMKDKAINILTAELSALPVLIMTYYALTAKPTGQWQLTFSIPVYWLISSDLLALSLAPHPDSLLAPQPP